MKIKMFEVAYFFMKNQCYLIYEDQEGILVDPAWEYTRIQDFLTQNKIMLKAVLVTHSHTDHTHLAEKFSKNNNVPIFMSDKEIEAYSITLFNLKKATHLEKITIGRFTITPIVTPGHTLGSTCYLIDHHLFTGDTVFIEGVGTCSYDNAGKLFDSVQFLKTYLPTSTVFWPGHSFGESPGKDLPYLMKNNIYFQFENQNHFIDFRTRKNRPDPFAFK